MLKKIQIMHKHTKKMELLNRCCRRFLVLFDVQFALFYRFLLELCGFLQAFKALTLRDNIRQSAYVCKVLVGNGGAFLVFPLDLYQHIFVTFSFLVSVGKAGHFTDAMGAALSQRA